MWHHYIKMEFQKIANFLSTTSDDKDLPRFVTKKWVKVYYQSGGNYNGNKEIRIKTSMLRSDLCDFGDAYIVAKGTITVAKEIFTADDFEAPNNTGDNANATNTASDNAFGEKKLVFKNDAPFMNCISKINGVKIDNAEDLDVVMPMHNLFEYGKNYRKTTGSLLNFSRDESSTPLSSNFESFKYKTSITVNTYNVGVGEEGYDVTKVGKNKAEVVIPLKHLSNFWRSLNIPLINCEVELILTWSKNCVLADMTVRDAGNNNDPPAIVAPTGLEFQITDTKLYVPVVTLSKENDIKLLEQLKLGFKRTIKWNKYRSQMTIQPQNNNLNYLIDPTFTNVNRLFVLSFPRNNNTDSRYSFSNYYVPKVKKERFFDMSVKNEEEAYEKIIEMSNNNDYTTSNLLDFAYFKKIIN